MRLVLEGDTVKFEPDFKDFEVSIIIIVYVHCRPLLFNPLSLLLKPKSCDSAYKKKKLLQVVLLNVYDVMIKAVMVVPRVETKLYSEWVSYYQHSVKMATCKYCS